MREATRNDLLFVYELNSLCVCVGEKIYIYLGNFWSHLFWINKYKFIAEFITFMILMIEGLDFYPFK